MCRIIFQTLELPVGEFPYFAVFSDAMVSRLYDEVRLVRHVDPAGYNIIIGNCGGEGKLFVPGRHTLVNEACRREL
jgi:hypothetical protein